MPARAGSRGWGDGGPGGALRTRERGHLARAAVADRVDAQSGDNGTMQVWRSVLAGLAALFLIQGCGPIYETTYDYTPPPSDEGRFCATQCQSLQQHCRSDCSHEERACERQKVREAERAYDRYVRERRADKQKVERTLDSFKSYRSCGADECRETCESDFRLCYETCGGTVTGVTRCVAGCDQAQ